MDEYSQVDSASTTVDSSSLTYAGPDLVAEEYSTQYFGFSAQSFGDGAYNAMNDYFHDVLTAAEQYMKEEFKDITCESELKNGTESLLKTFTKTMDRAFDKLEKYLVGNVFAIPASIVLPEDKVHAEHEFTADDEAKLDKEIEELENKIAQYNYVNPFMKQELIDGKVVMECYDIFLEKLKKIEAHLLENGITDEAATLLKCFNKAKKLCQDLKCS